VGAAVLVATLLGALRVDARANPMLPHVQRLVIVAGAFVALVIVRRGSEVRREFRLVDGGLEVSVGSRHARLQLEDVDRLYYAAPFAGSTSWIPATVLIDREGRSWRIPALLQQGDRLLRELLAAAGRNDLDAWADAYRVLPRMGRATLYVRSGYAVVVALLAAAFVYYFR
jgi:hypothetical protein